MGQKLGHFGPPEGSAADSVRDPTSLNLIPRRKRGGYKYGPKTRNVYVFTWNFQMEC